jgi:hypothetical protein
MGKKNKQQGEGRNHRTPKGKTCGGVPQLGCDRRFGHHWGKKRLRYPASSDVDETCTQQVGFSGVQRVQIGDQSLRVDRVSLVVSRNGDTIFLLTAEFSAPLV